MSWGAVPGRRQLQCRHAGVILAARGSCIAFCRSRSRLECRCADSGAESLVVGSDCRGGPHAEPFASRGRAGNRPGVYGGRGGRASGTGLPGMPQPSERLRHHGTSRRNRTGEALRQRERRASGPDRQLGNLEPRSPANRRAAAVYTFDFEHALDKIPATAPVGDARRNRRACHQHDARPADSLEGARRARTVPANLARGTDARRPGHEPRRLGPFGARTRGRGRRDVGRFRNRPQFASRADRIEHPDPFGDRFAG